MEEFTLLHGLTLGSIATAVGIAIKLRSVLREHTREKVATAVHETEQDGRLATIESRLDKGDRRFDALDATLREIKTSIASIETTLARMDARLDAIENGRSTGG